MGIANNLKTLCVNGAVTKDAMPLGPPKDATVRVSPV